MDEFQHLVDFWIEQHSADFITIRGISIQLRMRQNEPRIAEVPIKYDFRPTMHWISSFHTFHMNRH